MISPTRFDDGRIGFVETRSLWNYRYSYLLQYSMAPSVPLDFVSRNLYVEGQQKNLMINREWISHTLWTLQTYVTWPGRRRVDANVLSCSLMFWFVQSCRQSVTPVRSLFMKRVVLLENIACSTVIYCSIRVTQVGEGIFLACFQSRQICTKGFFQRFILSSWSSGSLIYFEKLVYVLFYFV